MIQAVIMANSYQDSINLMLLSNKLSDMVGVNKVSVMMGTPANKNIFQGTGLYTAELDKAGTNDICVVVDSDTEMLTAVMQEAETFLKNLAVKKSSSSIRITRSWSSSARAIPDANMALISVPGVYAAAEAKKALDLGLNAFIFSDNVDIKDEAELKRYADERGLVVMGPDCGTAIVGGVPLAFANVVRTGDIGVVGASGTGIQEVTSIIHRMGAGVSHAIGTGGRDLSKEVGAITAIAALKALAKDDATKVIVLISKPPAKTVRDRIVKVLKSLKKPAVAIFMGERGSTPQQNIRFASTLEQTAELAVELSKASNPLLQPSKAVMDKIKASGGGHRIFGLYAGGTLAAEAAFIIKECFDDVDHSEHKDGIYLELDGHKIVDFGDDVYTQGQPHPMIDSRNRVNTLKKLAADKNTSIILFDLVLGYGGNMDMASELAKGIEQARAIAAKDGREQIYIASICGTDEDPQGYQDQKTKLESAGVLMAQTNVKAVNAALTIFYDLTNDEEVLDVSHSLVSFLSNGPRVINVGVASFADPIKEHGGKVVQFNWAPVAGGDARLADILSKLV